MTLRPDPAGVFDSDAHRRVLAHLSPDEAMEEEVVQARLAKDPHALLDSDGVVDVLKSLSDDNYCSKSKAGWKMTKAGFDKLTEV